MKTEIQHLFFTLGKGNAQKQFHWFQWDQFYCKMLVILNKSSRMWHKNKQLS